MCNPEQTTDTKASGKFRGQLAGRSGFIVYRELNRELKVYWELSGSAEYDILVSPDFRSWSHAPEKHLSEEKQLSLLFALREWLSAQNVRSDIDQPADLSEETAPCIWAKCSGKRLKLYYYCKHHFDLSCLSR
jgi:hypothetical protein